MNLSKQPLIEAMKKCLPGVEKGSSLIEGADSFLFTGTAIHTYNDNIAVSVPVELDGLTGAVKAMDFFRLVSKLNAPLIQAEATEKKLTLMAGRTKADIHFISTQVGGYIDDLALETLTWQPMPANFAEGLRLCKMSCNPTPLRGISVDGAQMASTDSARINCFTLTTPMDSFWLDDPAVGELMKLGVAEQYAIHGAWFHAKMKDGAVFSCKRKDHSQFPSGIVAQQVTALMSEKANGIDNRLPKALTDAVERVATMASGASSSSSLIRLTFRQAEVELYASKAHGSAEETVLLETPFSADPNLVVWVESDFLTEAAKKVMDFSVLANGELPTLLFHSPNYIQLAATDSGMDSVSE